MKKLIEEAMNHENARDKETLEKAAVEKAISGFALWGW